MSIQQDVKNLTLEFFNAINADVSDISGIYRIIIPDTYENVFGTRNLLLAFDKGIASKHNCELVVLGNQILSSIMEICANKGPVAFKSTAGDAKYAIRYHFFINFSGKSNIFMTDHVDINLKSKYNLRISDHLGDEHPLRWIEPKQVLETYTHALNVLKGRYEPTANEFTANANNAFKKDLAKLTSKHNSDVRELDNAIRRKDESSEDHDKITEFRFDTIDMIEMLEKEKNHLIEVMQKKHQVMLSYGLVACEIISS